MIVPCYRRSAPVAMVILAVYAPRERLELGVDHRILTCSSPPPGFRGFRAETRVTDEGESGSRNGFALRTSHAPVASFLKGGMTP